MFVVTIVQHAPRWVWILLAGLIVVGISQSFPRRRTIRSATIIPVAMIMLSFYGVVSAFPSQPAAIIAWACGVTAALMLANAMGAWRAISWSEKDRRLLVPGSWVPMVVILGLFVTKFGVGATLAMRPEFALDGFFGTAVGFAYGIFSGTFLSRGVAMWKAAQSKKLLGSTC